MLKTYDYCVFGAGLAGLNVAKSLIELNSDCSILIIDPKGIGGGASGTPIGLVNPATGRYATKSWRAEESVQNVINNFKDVEKYNSTPFYKKSGVIRPAADEKIARRMHENLETTEWEESWVKWLTESEINKQFPGLYCVEGGLLINEAITVAIPSYLKALSNYLVDNGVSFEADQSYQLSRVENNWSVKFGDGECINPKNIIITAGISSNIFDFYRDLPLIAVKGQLALFESENPFPFQHAVSALGYYASLDNHVFVAGSTYEHKFTHEGTDEYGADYVQNRLYKIIPELKNTSKLIKQWSGVRASTPDRMPIVGKHHIYTNCYTLCGLGSKGLLYSALFSKELANAIINKTEISSEVNINRFF